MPGGRAPARTTATAIALLWRALLVGAAMFLFAACPEKAAPREAVVAGPCGPAEEHYETGLFQVGRTTIPTTPVPTNYAAWLLGAARPDCAADVEILIERMDGTPLDFPPGALTARAMVECWIYPLESKSYPVGLTQTDAFTLEGRFHVDSVPPCMDEAHRSAAQALGQPFAPVTILLAVDPSATSPTVDGVRMLYGVTTFRYVPFATWRSAADAGTDAGDAGPRVRIVSPANEAVVVNPVKFTVTATDDIAKVQLKADDKHLVGVAFDPKVQQEVTKTFSQLGRRTIQALGFDSAGKQLDRHEIAITVVEEVKVAPTYYHVALESELPGAEQTITAVGCGDLSRGGKTIMVSKAFFESLCIEGTGRLIDGTVINYVDDCDAVCKDSPACPQLSGETHARIKCYRVLDPAKKYDWGEGSRAGGCPLVPLESWATDPQFIDSGTTIYAPSFADASVPTLGEVAGRTLDGCFRADDTGSAIKGYHVDVFAGSVAMEKELQKHAKSTPPPYTPWMAVQLNHPKCEHLRR